MHLSDTKITVAINSFPQSAQRLGRSVPLLLMQYLETPIEGQYQAGICAKLTIGSAVKIKIGLWDINNFFKAIRVSELLIPLTFQKRKFIEQCVGCHPVHGI